MIIKAIFRAIWGLYNALDKWQYRTDDDYEQFIHQAYIIKRPLLQAAAAELYLYNWLEGGIMNYVLIKKGLEPVKEYDRREVLVKYLDKRQGGLK